MMVWVVGYAICWLDGGAGVSGVIAQTWDAIRRIKAV